MQDHARTIVSSQLSYDPGPEDPATGADSPGDQVFHTHVFHGGYLITVGGETGAWWARIDELLVETMLFADRAAALAAGLAFVDGMTRSIRRKRLWDRRFDRP